VTLDARHEYGAIPLDASCDSAACAAIGGAGAVEVRAGRKRAARDAPLDGVRAFGLSRAALGRVHDFIDRHIGDHFRLEDMAQAACMSQFHFTRRFKESLQQSPMHYVLERRIELAKMELALGKKKVAAIAFDLGFCDQSHFTRSFRRFTGMSPSAFANMQMDKRVRNGSDPVPR